MRRGTHNFIPPKKEKTGQVPSEDRNYTATMDSGLRDDFTLPQNKHSRESHES